jgi:mRNA-degrading endonuclease RelE of RelBE toxin-antitoxin system
MTNAYRLQISTDVEKRLDRFRPTVGRSIRELLREIALGAGKAGSRAKPTAPREPPLRFCDYEGYRVSYQIDSGTRRVVVLDLGRVTS